MGLILISAFLHALWNTLVKESAEPRARLIPILIVASLFSPLITLLFLERSLGAPEAWGWTVGSGLCEAGYMICLGYTLEKGPMGLSYIIMRGGAMIIVWLIATLFLGEALHFYSGVGLLMVFVGLAVTQFQAFKTHQTKSFMWSSGAAFFIAGYHLCYGQALRLGIGPGALFTFSLWISVPLLVLFSGRIILQSAVQEMRQSPRKLIFGGVICSLSFIFFLKGLATAGAGHAITLRNTSVVFAQGLALTLGEKVSLEQWMGSFLVALGAMLSGLA